MNYRIEILRTPVDPYSMEETLERSAELIEEGGPHLICTVNLRHVMMARRDPEFADLTRRAEISVADGMPLIWVSRLAGTPLQERVTGVDLVPALCGLAAKRGYRVYFIGAAPGVAEELAKRLQAKLPGLEVCGTTSPPMGFDSDPEANREAIARIREAKPDILFAAFGAPRQEQWLDAHREELGVPLTIGVGAAFDFLTDRQQRAPVWMQECGMEWLYRVFCRPLEMGKRTLRNGPLFLLLILDQLTYRMQRSAVLRLKPALLGLTDAVVTLAAWLGAYFIYFRSGLFSMLRDPSPGVPLLEVPGYINLLPFVVVAMWVGMAWNRMYERETDSSPPWRLSRVLRGVVTGLVLTIVYIFVDKDIFVGRGLRGFSTGMFATFALCQILGLLIARRMMGLSGRLLSRMGVDVDRILLVGVPPDEEALRAMVASRDRGWRVIGYLHDGEPGEGDSTVDGLECLGGYDDLRRILHGRKVDEVLALHFAPGDPRLLDLARTCAAAGVRIGLLPRGFELLTYSSEIRRRCGLRLICIEPSRLREWN